MAVKVGVAYVDIKPDLKQFGRELRTEVARDMSAAGKEAATSLRKSLSSAVTGLAAGFGAAKVGGFMRDAVKAASDLNEEVSKSQAVFKSAAPAIESWAKGAAQNLGLSERAALSAAGTFGNMFAQLGFTSDQAADMSKTIVGLGVDFRSFSNADISDVLDGQAAAFRGEYDSLQRFLPLLSAATVEQRAMELTGKRNADQLTAQDKAMAVYRLMIEGAGDAAGDFARTHDSLANSMQSTQAATENASASIGQQMIPAMQQWNQILRDDLIPALTGLFSTQGEAPAWAAAIQDAVGDLVGWLVGTVQQAMRLMANFFDRLPTNIGKGVAQDLRDAADSGDAFRDRMHASREELAGFASSTRNAEAAQKLLAPATKAAASAAAASVSPLKAAKDATDDLAKAQRDLLGAQRDVAAAKRDVADADRGVTKAQRERDLAAAAFAEFGGDTNADKLAEADENLADAKDAQANAHDHLADARDRELDVLDRLKKLDDTAISGATPFKLGMDLRTESVRQLNAQLGIAQAQIDALKGDAGNILKLTTGKKLDPSGANPNANLSGVNPNAGTAMPGSLGGGVPTQIINVYVQSTQNADPSVLSKDIAWNLRTGPAKVSL